MIIQAKTRHGRDSWIQEWVVADDFTVQDLQDLLKECVYPYRVKDSIADALHKELVATGETQHGWTDLKAVTC